MLIEAGLDDREHAVNWLKGRLRGGALKAGGWHLVVLEDDPIKTDVVVGLYKLSTWRQVAAIPYKDDFWVSGDYTPDDPLDSISRSFERDEFDHYLTGVRFEPASVEGFCRRANPQPQQTEVPTVAPPIARRGAKRKDWWDHLWIEMIRRMLAGNLHPKRPADLEREMLIFVENDLGETVGDSTLKPMASNLFKFLQEIRGKIGEN